MLLSLNKFFFLEFCIFCQKFTKISLHVVGDRLKKVALLTFRNSPELFSRKRNSVGEKKLKLTGTRRNFFMVGY